MSTDARIVGSMTRTLADMTPAERAACVGRWADDGDDLGIIGRIYDSGTAQLIFPYTYQTGGSPLHAVTPRTDLPRAWTADGEPADMDVETGRVEYGRIWCGSEIMERTNLPDGTTVHRHVTDWEVAP